jgi:hypothetical protein
MKFWPSQTIFFSAADFLPPVTNFAFASSVLKATTRSKVFLVGNAFSHYRYPFAR